MRDVIVAYLCIALLQIMSSSCKTQGDELRGDDIRLFAGPVSELAKAVENEDAILIGKILAENKMLLNYQEPKFGKTLLHWSVRTGHRESVKALLENGADPNLQDTYDGESALMIACGYGPNYDTSTFILKLLVKFGGNPNTEEGTPRREGNRTRNTPLINAAGCCLNKTKVLIDAGADINYVNEFNGSALEAAMSGGRDAVHVTRYLLIERNAKVPEYFAITNEGNKITILNYLRNWIFDLNSKEYEIKMEIVDFLSTKGLNYWETPIPKVYYKNYPKEFLEKY